MSKAFKKRPLGRWGVILRIAGGILLLLLLVWLAAVGYILLHKTALLQKIRTELSNRMGSGLQIGELDISFTRHFPYPSLLLSKVSLRDSVWQQHHHDLLKVETIEIRLSPARSLAAGQLQAGKVFLQQGTVYLYTDTSGYSNTSVLSGLQQPAGKARDVQPPDIALTDIKVVYDQQERHKLFGLDIRDLDCAIEKDKRTLLLQVHAGEIGIDHFSFNTAKGDFLKGSILTGHFLLQYSPASHIIQGTHVSIRINGHPFLFSGRFFPTVHPDPFFLTLQTSEIPYREATALLTPVLQQKLNAYDIDQPVSVNAQLDAGSADDPTPQMLIRMNLDKGNVITPAGRFTAVSFKGSFTNEWVHGKKREDENSAVRLAGFAGTWENIPLTADTITITDLHHPFVACDLHTKIGLPRLNELAGSRTLRFEKGTCALNITYRGPLSEHDTVRTMVNGTLNIDTATVVYLPYQFRLTDCNGSIRLKDQDLLVDRLEAHAGSSKVTIRGSARNLVTLLDQNVQNVVMDWTLRSPRLDLGDFTALAGRPLSGAAAPKAPFSAAASRIDQVLKDGQVHVQIEAADLRYKKFAGAHARADLQFSNEEIRLNKMELDQGSGSLSLSATLRRHSGARTGNASTVNAAGAADDAGVGANGDNALSLQSHLEGVDLPKLFTAFNNFGQPALTDKNLKGRLTADIHMTGLLTDKAEMAPNSLKGTVDFSIKDGQLIDFGPMEKIHETVLQKRDLSEIRFAELRNQLDLDTTTITIHRMEIQSTAFTLFVEGVYDLKTGADLSIQIPLSNLKERPQGAPPSNKGNHSGAGLSLRLRAKTGEDGKLKVSWDPFKRALKNKNTPAAKNTNHK